MNHIKIISFELSNNCNLKKYHPKCPINHRHYDKCNKEMSNKRIIELMDDAVEHGFTGMFAFHYYNEPLLSVDRIKDIIGYRKNYKYLLWTNGLLFNRNVSENNIIKLFHKVVITCYKEENKKWFEQIKEVYKNVEIGYWSLDNRGEIYSESEENIFGCQRINIELPIDSIGNVHLCTIDWKQSVNLGNVKDRLLSEIICGRQYRNIHKNVFGKQLGDDAPEICKRCTMVMHIDEVAKRITRITGQQLVNEESQKIHKFLFGSQE